MKLLFFLLLCFCACLCAEERVVSIGPRTVPAGGMDELDLEGPQWLKDLEEPLAMHQFFVKLMDTDGNDYTQERAYLHHLLISGRNIESIPCPEYGGYNFVAGSGQENTTIEIPAPYAYKIKPGDEWSIALHVVNPSEDEEIVYTIQYIIIVDEWTDDFIEVDGYLNDVTGCADGSLEFDVPQQENHTSYILYADFPSSFTGTFVWLAGHLHRGGKNVYFSRSSTGEVLFSSNVHYDDPEHEEFITSIDSSDTFIEITRDEPLRITAVYDCQKEHKGSMGIVFGYAIIEELYSGHPPLNATFGHDNPFEVAVSPSPSSSPLPSSSPSLAVIEESYSDYNVTYSAVQEEEEEEEEEEPLDNVEGEETEDDKVDKEDKAFLGILATSGLILMFVVALILLVAVVLLVRIKSKRSIEIFD